MRPFDYYSPTSVPEALDLLANLSGRGRVLAGGTDLVAQMKAGTATPEAVINIKRLPGFRGLDFDAQDGLRLGALVTVRELTRSAVVREHYPCLAHAASVLATEKIRNTATVGGNLCNASPAADLPPTLMVLGASVRLVSREGERRLPLADFFLGPGESALRTGEMLREVQVPPPDGAAVYYKLTPREFMDIAVVGVAAGLLLDGDTCRRARVALGAVAPVPLRARRAEDELNGQGLTAERVASSARIAAEECSPVDDVRGSAWYRKRMVELLVRRAITVLVGSGAD